MWPPKQTPAKHSISVMCDLTVMFQWLCESHMGTVPQKLQIQGYSRRNGDISSSLWGKTPPELLLLASHHYSDKIKPVSFTALWELDGGRSG